LRPTISPNLLNGTGNIAEVSRKIETIQLNEIALSENSFAITGSARFMDEPINGINNVAMHITNNTELRFNCGCSIFNN
jgi:hypothetical protein